MRRIGSIAIAVSFAGCTGWKLAEPKAALPPLGPPLQAVAKVCVIRGSMLWRSVTFPTRDNGLLVGATQGSTYFCYLAEPGAHEISIDANDIERANLWAQAGGSYYLEQEVEPWLDLVVTCHLDWIDEAAAAKIIGRSDYRILVGVPDRERLPPNPPFAPSKRVASSR